MAKNFDQYAVMSWKRCEIGFRLLLCEHFIGVENGNG